MAACRIVEEYVAGNALDYRSGAFPATYSYTIRHAAAVPWRSILILSTHLRLGLPSGLFPSGFPTKTLYTPLSSPIRATCPAHLILLDFINRTILGEEYSFIRHGRRNWAESCHNILFQSGSFCDRNTSIGAVGLWEWGSERIERFSVVFSISRRKGAGRRWRERWKLLTSSGDAVGQSLH